MQNKKRVTKRRTREHEDDEETEQQTPEEFARELFGTADKPQNDLGFPTLEWLKSQFKTKSAVIRYLVNQGFAIKDIAKHLDLKYQHVRNVATSKLKRGPNEDWHPPAERKDHFGE